MTLLARRTDLTGLSGGGDEALISISATANVAVATIDVPAVRERQATILRQRLAELAGRSGGRLVVSMHQVTDMTSACIIALIQVGDECRARGGRLVVTGLSRRLRRVFRSARIQQAVTVSRTAEEALRCFDRARRGRWSLFGLGAPAARRDAA